MKKTAQVKQLMMELNEERAGVQDALIEWEEWLDSEREGYHEDGPNTDELLEEDETGEGRALLERVTCLATAFQAKLCDLLGVSHQPLLLSGYGCRIIVTVPIDGGDEGVTTSIWYAYSHKEHAYELTMSKELPVSDSSTSSTSWPRSRKLEDYAQDTEQLVILIGRGYMALRLMEGGTRYYHTGRQS